MEDFLGQLPVDPNSKVKPVIRMHGLLKSAITVHYTIAEITARCVGRGAIVHRRNTSSQVEWQFTVEHITLFQLAVKLFHKKEQAMFW